ncbi:aldehyde dehydrogenase family protein [Francisella sp. SYW-9]|uniref:aldehyde dehydrogenase family protein n=1 Tax=Francisella sp. SYW-9 TaxID=2610888 RepID=UPI00123DF527|nr:aldehyde dehydrogenase family protein [Francisella sp. SYW-9]
MKHYLNYINGQWVDSKESINVDNPATEKPYATIARATKEDAEQAILSAHNCVKQKLLTDIKPEQRTKWMLKASKLIKELAEDKEAILVLCRENGKRYCDAKDEFLEAARYFEYYAGMADKIEGISVPLGKDYLDFTHYVPFGVSVQIVPWNFPVSICARSLAPALAAGNAVVIKSPELSPIAVSLLIGVVEKAGFPKGAINLLCGKGSEIGSYLVKHHYTNQIVFTGSVPTGQRILKDAADRAVPSVMELGGKSAGIVLEDYDHDALLQSVRNGIFFNAGQVCSAMSRLLIHRSVYEKVKTDVVSLAESLSLGQGEANADMTPVVSLEQKQGILKMIQQAKNEGANILTGGKELSLDGYYVLPTIIEANESISIFQEEVFGPVLVITPFDSESEAIKLANGTEFGLCAGVFGRDLNKTLNIARELRGGQVFINEWFAGGIETPFGGVGLSGFGREKGQEAIYSYVQTQNIGIRLKSS